MTNIAYLNGLKKATDLKAAWGDTKAYHRWLKNQCREFGTYAAQRDRLEHSMRDGMDCQRFRADDDGEGWALFGFVTSEDVIFDYDTDRETIDEAFASLTDDEIDEWFEQNVAIRIRCGHDCTGGSFTMVIKWHRNPDGSISFVHRVGIDV